MPWMMHKNGEKVCVYKEGADGKAEGEALHCYSGADAEEMAKKYMKALYAHAGDMQIHLSGDSLDQRATAVREGFVHAFYPQYEESNKDSYAYIREIYDEYVIVDAGGKLFKVPYTKGDKEITFEPRDKWQAVKIDYVDMSILDRALRFLGFKSKPDPKPHLDLWAFSFTELSDSAKAIDGLAANEDIPFISMHGEEVYIKSNELAAYIENTLTVIESTKTESGEIVGLPIDLEGHNHKGGAGWIVGLELDSARKVIRFLVNWTEKGIELIKGNLSRFFSPSVDTENKIILGGSLTNWPASRNAKGQILLRPVELSQSIKEIDMEKTLLEMLAELPGKVAEAVRGGKETETPTTTQPPTTELETEISPALKELLRTPEGIEELGKKAQELARDAIHLEKRKMHTVQFASKLAGGTAEHPVGLKVRPNEVVALLLSLPEPQALAVEKILQGALEGAVNFSMRGLDGNGFIQKPELSKAVKPYLRTWVDAGKSIDEFFKLNVELGNPEDYNLSEFIKKEA